MLISWQLWLHCERISYILFPGVQKGTTLAVGVGETQVQVDMMLMAENMTGEEGTDTVLLEEILVHLRNEWDEIGIFEIIYRFYT